jgi:DNA-binding NtrC family response regulator
MYQPEIERISEEVYFIAGSPAMRRLRTQAELLSQTEVPVLVTGEPGSGKCTAARLIHSLSIRSGFQFIRVKCGALTADLLEKELFGYEHSAGSGLSESIRGKLEECARGTILLDEFDVLPAAVQMRLLRLLETGEFTHCGGRVPVHADARIIATTSSDLDLAVAEKKVQEELFYRLSAFELRVPPLRERLEEIPVLLGHMINRLTKRYGVPAPRVSTDLLDACQEYAWPGNLRELEHFAKHYLARGDENIAISDLRSRPGYGRSRSANGATHSNGHSNSHPRVPMAKSQSGETSSLKLLVRNAKLETEKGAIVQALEQTRWNRKAAARLLRVSYRALLYKIQEYQLVPPTGDAAQMFGTDGLGELK